MQEINFLESLHTSTKRNYLERACLPDRAECMRIASQYGADYWDGDRKYGYGGMKYDGRWKTTAEKIIAHYALNQGSNILDAGCGKGYLLYEFEKLGMKTSGYDISEHAIASFEPKQKSFRIVSDCRHTHLWPAEFDLLLSINMLHNLNYRDLKTAIREIARDRGNHAWICVESFRNEEEKCNLLNWALTCQSYYSPDDWKNILSDNGYTGDVGFVFFQ